MGQGCNKNDVQRHSSHLGDDEGVDKVWSGFNNSFSSPRGKHTAKRPWISKKAAARNEDTKQHSEEVAKSVDEPAKTVEQPTKTLRPNKGS